MLHLGEAPVVRRCHLPLTILWLALCSPASWAVDYGKIDRSIRREPVYKTKSPKYALLLFGREAKTRVWLVLDGKTVYLDRNGDGDLTAKDECFANYTDCKDIEIADMDGKTRYLITRITDSTVPGNAHTHLGVEIDIVGPISYSQGCNARMKANPESAPIVHFHGPLTMHASGRIFSPSDEKPPKLSARVSTVNEDYGCYVWVESSDNEGKYAFAEGVFPVVDIEFPAKRPGRPAIKRRYALDEFC
jgi:hypothetical protein